MPTENFDQNNLPQSVIIDPVSVREIIMSAASACATELSLSNVWERDTSLSGRFVQYVEDHNPVSMVYNGVAYGDWSAFSGHNLARFNPLYALITEREGMASSATGAVAVKVNAARRTQLCQSLYLSFFLEYEARCAESIQKGHDYLKSLIGRTTTAMRNTSERFERANTNTAEVKAILDNALDRTYRISVGASVAFMIVGCLPIAAGGSAAAIAEAASLSVAASTGTPGVVVAKVAGLGVVHGFLTNMIFDPGSISQAKIGGWPVKAKAATTAAVTNASSTVGQHVYSTLRMSGPNNRLNDARQALQGSQVRNQVRNAMRDARSFNPPEFPPTARRFPPGGVTEAQVARLEAKQAQIAEQVLKENKWIGRGASALAIGIGAYLLHDDVKRAWRGITK